MSQSLMWREADSVWRCSGTAVIRKNESLTKAPSTNGRFVFSNVGAGIRPLALIGTWDQLMYSLSAYPGDRIENLVTGLGSAKGIFMSVKPYVPGKPYSGLFPLHDAVSAVVTGAVGLAAGAVPGGVVNGDVLENCWGHILNDTAAVATDGHSIGKQLFGGSSGVNLKRAGELYVRFHYLKDKKMVRIGKNVVYYRGIKALLMKSSEAL